MGDCGCGKTGLTACEFVGVILSIIAGVAIGILFSLGLIPVTINFIIVALVFSAVALVILVGSLIAANAVKGYNGFYKCVCKFSKMLLVGAIGTLLSTTVSITVGFTIVTIASIIFVALSAFFFVLTVVAIICLISCIIEQNCKCRNEVF